MWLAMSSPEPYIEAMSELLSKGSVVLAKVCTLLIDLYSILAYGLWNTSKTPKPTLKTTFETLCITPTV